MRKQDNHLTIKVLAQNILKRRIFAFLGARESLFQKTRVLKRIL